MDLLRCIMNIERSAHRKNSVQHATNEFKNRKADDRMYRNG